MEKYGFGNWKDISSHVGFGKTEKQCRNYYQKYFLEQPNCLPEKVEIMSKMKNELKIDIKAQPMDIEIQELDQTQSVMIVEQTSIKQKSIPS